jgi:uncharacterized protein with von Willebrand factor type A (vWA) domain
VISDPRAQTVDVRSSLRRNLRFGEELVLLQATARRKDRARVAVRITCAGRRRTATPVRCWMR